MTEAGPRAEGEQALPAVFHADRLVAVRAAGLLDTGPDEAFDRLARLARSLLDAPFAFVTIVDESRSFWKSCIGVDAVELHDRQNSVEESFCQYVINTDDVLIVGDARLNPMTSANASIEKMGVLAWAGIPLRSVEGHVLGTFCVVDTKTRDWSGDDVEILESLAGAVEGEIRLRVMLDDAAATADNARREAGLRERLSSLAERLAAAETTDAVAGAITNLGPGVLGASLATLAIVDETRRHLVLRGPVTDRQDLGTEYTTISIDDDLPIAEASRLARPVYLANTAEMHDRFPHIVADATALGIVATASIPLRGADGAVLGALTVAWDSETSFDLDERARLRTVSWMCAQSLQRSQVGDVRRELIEQLQRELLPPTPEVGGLEVAVRYLPATSGLGIGGDWYDIVELDDGRVTVIVGDIPGHGIEAAARMSQVRGAINALARLYTDDLPKVLSEAERILSHLHDRYVATAVILTIDPVAGTITYVAAGHPAPILVHSDATVSVLEGGRRPLLGYGNGSAEVGRASLADGAAVLAFTDGLVERRDQDVDAGTDRLITAIGASNDCDPGALVDRIIAELVAGDIVNDDVALVAIRLARSAEDDT